MRHTCDYCGRALDSGSYVYSTFTKKRYCVSACSTAGAKRLAEARLLPHPEAVR